MATKAPPASTNGGSVRSTSSEKKEDDGFLYRAVRNTVVAYLFYWCCATAYQIRLQAIEEFGPVIHEFDPYFNFRATEVRN